MGTVLFVHWGWYTGSVLAVFFRRCGEWWCTGELWEEANLLAVPRPTRRRSLLNLGNTGVKHCFAIFRVSFLMKLPTSCEDAIGKNNAANQILKYFETLKILTIAVRGLKQRRGGRLSGRLDATF